MTAESYRGESAPASRGNPLLIVLSGPSGVGKDAVLARLRETDHRLTFVTTLTTRPIRPDEVDGRDYHFVSRDEYRKLLRGNRLLESANVYGNWYGVPRSAVEAALDRGEDAIVKVDIQGAATIRKVMPRAVFVFLAPPSLDELTARLTRRLTESPADLSIRIKTAEEEMKQAALFDHVIVNHSGAIDETVAEIEAIIAAEKRRAVPGDAAL
ncbi:MAG: guanylate kinase [Dehalococcoidales bacterium]